MAREYKLNEEVPTFTVIDRASGDKVRVDDRTYDPKLHRRKDEVDVPPKTDEDPPKKKKKKARPE